MSQDNGGALPLTHTQARPTGPFNAAVYGVEADPETDAGRGAKDTRKIGRPRRAGP